MQEIPDRSSTPNLISRLKGFWERRASRWFARREILVLPPYPMVSFAFDDFPHSAASVGARILESHGARGTFYVSLGLQQTVTPTGQMFNLEDIERLAAAGHELGCHTYDHLPAWPTPTEEYEASIHRNSAALAKLLPGATFSTHSFPISNPRPTTKRIVAQQFAGCRGGGQSFNRGVADLNNLASFFIEQSVRQPEAIHQIIDKNAAMGGWLILSTHDVSDSPTRFGCTPKMFEEIVRRVLTSGNAIMPVRNSLLEVQQRHTPDIEKPTAHRSGPATR